MNAFIKQLPNTITLSSLACGLLAVFAALEQNWQISCLFIVSAIILDGLDGFVARRLNACSKVGAQLDSLVDNISFGAAPAVILYLWSLQYGEAWHSSAAIFYTACTSIRLARFNVSLTSKNKPQEFIGVPSPFAALIAITPMLISFYTPINQLSQPTYLSIWITLVALTMVAPKESLFFKGAPKALSVIFLFSLLISLYMQSLWLFLAIIALTYLTTVLLKWVIK